MPRIGILIDTLQGSVPASFQEKLSAYVKEFPEVIVCFKEDDLNSSDAISRINRYVESEGFDRVVILGGSPKDYEISFQKLKLSLPLNPYLFSVANIREQALWISSDEEMALERAKIIISKAIHTVNSTKPIPTQSLTLNPEVLILGGGLIGISIALDLAHAGIRVFIIEKEDRLGGKAQKVFKWLEEKIDEVEKNPKITVLTQARLKRVVGHLGRFEATIECPDRKEITLAASAMVVSTGYASYRERKGIYAHKRVVAIEEMEKIMAEASGPSLLKEGKKIEMVTYLLDEVNEDIKIDSISAIRQSLILQDLLGCQVAVLCKDIKVSSNGMERLYRRAREKGVLFFKYDDPPRLSIVDGQIEVDLKDTSPIQKKERWPVSILSDLVVIGESFGPIPEAEELSKVLKIHLGPRGYFMEDNPQLLRVRSNRKGIFIAGACRFPQEASEALIEARAVSQEIITLLSKGTYPYDLAVAEVDPKKCALCYTCPRLCPHSAITIEKYGDRNVYTTPMTNKEMKWGAAKVDPASCYGCGICVAECPAKAITLQHLTSEQIYAQMNLGE